MTILTRGYDPMVRRVIDYVAREQRRLHLVISEGRPLNDGLQFAKSFHYPSLTTTVIPDAAVGLWMDKVKAVLVGTDLILEDGGLLAPVGTYNICALASIHRKSVYCVCETYKFRRKFVLTPDDLSEFQRTVSYPTDETEETEVETARVGEFDFTPAKFVTLLLTEKGPMPPSAVTHELTKLLGVE
jgi:translation initiation factor 2B subunit (eIF-2B alpha/beta/delta family)